MLTLIAILAALNVAIYAAKVSYHRAKMAGCSALTADVDQRERSHRGSAIRATSMSARTECGDRPSGVSTAAPTSTSRRSTAERVTDSRSVPASDAGEQESTDITETAIQGISTRATSRSFASGATSASTMPRIQSRVSTAGVSSSRFVEGVAERATFTSFAGGLNGLRSLKRAVVRNRAKTWHWQDLRKAPRSATRYPERWSHSASYLRFVAERWRARALAAHKAYIHWFHWSWADWLPDKWARIGACETGYGRRPGNWRHSNSSYEGAFGFAKSSWDAFKYRADPKAGPYPADAWMATPRQQYEVALAIYRAYGLSGWGCAAA